MGKLVIFITLLAGVLGLFVDSIRDLMTSELASTLLIPAFLIYFTFVFATKGIEKFKHENVKELKIEDYYRDLSKKELIEQLEIWFDLLTQTELTLEVLGERSTKGITKQVLKKHDVKPEVYALGKVIGSTWIYGKERTNKLLVQYQRYNYESDNLDGLKALSYIAMIISSLRKDLMNVDSDPIDLLLLKIKDANEPEKLDAFKVAIKEIEDEIK
ncbi:hypothetical protein ACBR55_12365 [Salinicoccus roseus]|uniref:hypothetical protein n=1 Tax=Salinicoccus roseus TaxID=45670 RepID=UPI003524CFFB